MGETGQSIKAEDIYMKEKNKSVYTVQHSLYVCVRARKRLSSSHSSCSLLYPSFIRRIHIAHAAIEKKIVR
jgi:hypothetical protein